MAQGSRGEAVTRRTGRRPGKQDTRGAILAAARETFAERGYDAASIRQIATGAGVDPALVHHYFGSKEKLFFAVVQPPVDPSALFPKIFAGGIDGIDGTGGVSGAGGVAERTVRTFLAIWEDPTTGPAFLSLLRTAVSNEKTGQLMREFFATQVVRRVTAEMGGYVHIDPDEIPLRTSLVASQLFGLALARYVLGFEPLAGAAEDTVVAAVAPTIRRYLTGDIAIGK
jgi:AcrR family transcriptional regulator